MQQSSETLTTRAKYTRPVYASPKQPEEWELNGMQVAIRVANAEDRAWLVRQARKENRSLCNMATTLFLKQLAQIRSQPEPAETAE